uniref:Angiotensin-converting enzyme n=1 Tax=Takifugu rubripes TaxID=31033 RepID=A0A674NHT0_TAKRU
MSARIRILVALLAMSCAVFGQSDMENQTAQFLKEFDEKATERMYNYSLASWAYNTNITKENSRKLAEEGQIWSEFYTLMSNESQKFNIDQIKNAEIKLQLIFLQDKGSGALSPDKAQHVRVLLPLTMNTIYSTATVCLLDDPYNCQTLEPGLENVMANSRNYSERLHVWEGWRRAVGKKMRPLYEDYVDLKNEASKLNGFEDYGAYWRYNYETIEEDSQYRYTRDELMHDVRSILPLYKELHAYVRARLMEVYPGHIDSDGPLPAHLLGDMWGRFWTNLYSLATPYPDKTDIDVSKTMVAKGWNETDIFRSAEDFFVSVGLYEMFPNFWTNSMLTKPTDGRQVVCHPTAWDMGNREDFRIKMCTKVTMDDFLTAHHEMGHNQYQMAYRNLPYLLRDGANEGFHEAVGEIMSLSAATPGHLQSLKLLPDNFTYDKETEINFLLKQALTIVATLPFTYMLEEWRWQVFAGNITKDEWMKQWWEMKREMVGVMEGVPRDETYCDPPALFHVSGDYSFIRYFTRTIYQFQFQKALCDAANHTGDLSSCDITGSKEAGTKLRNMLELGRSQSWTRALETISGDRRMDARPLLDYFKKLHEWLIEENQKYNRTVGWKTETEPCKYEITKEYKHICCTFAEVLGLSFLNSLISDLQPLHFDNDLRLSRGRINQAFNLDDSTLEFVGIVPTLAPPVEQPVEVWLIIFGVVMGIVVLGGVYLIISGVRERRKKPIAVDNPYIDNDGHMNKAYDDSDNEQTGF